MPRTLVFTATYNEVDNIGSLIGEIFHYLPDAEILVVDDNSPDGTGELLDGLAVSNDKIHAIHRPMKLGLGSAHLLAMQYAIHHKFDHLVTMDADFSHHPKYLPTLVGLLSDKDFVIGSRYIEGGKCDYGRLRTFISKSANLASRFVLGTPLKETTTSYRGFVKSLLKRLDLNSIRSDGYSFFVESLFVVSLVDHKLGEFPIHFEDRRAGTSKISKKEIFKGLLTLLRIFYRRFFKRAKEENIEESQNSFSILCENCQSPYHMEIFPPTSSVFDRVDSYQCTTYAHSSHGRIIKCLSCGLVFSEPRHSAEKIIEMYSKVEDKIYVDNLDSRYQTFQYNLHAIKNFIPPSGRLLDIGTYCGVFLKVARERGYDPQGIEPSKWASNFAKEFFKQTVFCGTLREFPQDKGNFNIIFMWDVIEHVPHPLEEMKLVNSRLKMGGTFVFSTMDRSHWFPRIMKSRWPWLMDMHLFYFDDNTVAQFAKKSGFVILKSLPCRHIITLEYFLYKLEALGIPGCRILKYLVQKSPFGKYLIPISLGDIKIHVCKKIHEPQ